jgi:hypothetical protein
MSQNLQENITMGETQQEAPLAVETTGTKFVGFCNNFVSNSEVLQRGVSGRIITNGKITD